ncbi:MAG TPA: hypothetical protein VFD27_12265, partial [Chthoniobacteraceae bacterium]|nr:hypothetical protein [Chthoniobacteraceae bacterium]
MHTRSSLEPLESRIAPSAVFTFTDVDDDIAQITSSKGTNVDLMAAAHVTDGQLTLLDLTSAVFQGAAIKINIKTIDSSGDGLVNVGYINATGRDLLIVEVHGDLGRIDAGDGTFTTSGISALTVASLGRLGTSTQDAEPAPSLLSTINGALFNLTVNSDVIEAHVVVRNVPSARLGISKLTIGGSLIGGNDPGSGEIETNGMSGQVK